MYIFALGPSTVLGPSTKKHCPVSVRMYLSSVRMYLSLLRLPQLGVREEAASWQNEPMTQCSLPRPVHGRAAVRATTRRLRLRGVGFADGSTEEITAQRACAYGGRRGRVADVGKSGGYLLD